METDISECRGEPSSPSDDEMGASTKHWANWTADQIRGAIETERARTFALLTEVLTEIETDLIPEVVTTLPALQGPAGPVGPAGKLPTVRAWQADQVHYEGAVVTHAGATWQASKDTGQEPGGRDWVCLASAGRDGRTPRVRGTYHDAVDDYQMLDLVALDGACFIARKDSPGTCPGEDWQLIARQGKRGLPANEGRRAIGVLPAPPAPKGKDATSIAGWTVDPVDYSATPLMCDGTSGPPLNLRGCLSSTSTKRGDA